MIVDIVGNLQFIRNILKGMPMINSYRNSKLSKQNDHAKKV
jgi:hypothetical protein